MATQGHAPADLQLLGDVGLGEAESRGVLNESALSVGRHIFGSHFPVPCRSTKGRARVIREIKRAKLTFFGG
jgi:hypothetical protein